jgi:hypothetical protein
MGLSVICRIYLCNTGIGTNGLQLTEVGDYEAQTFKFKQMYNRSRNANITTTPPILVRCCYVPFLFTNLN